MGPITGLRELISMILRRGPLIAAVIAIGAVATIAYVSSLPRAYQAINVIQLEPSPLQASAAAGGPDTAARLRLIEQRIMARESILNMIHRHGLFEDAEQMTEDQRIILFRKDVNITMIPSAGGGGGTESGVSALLITVNAGDSLKAADLANDIADQIVSGNRSAVERRLAELVAALQAENERLGNLIERVQANIELVRREEKDALPDNLEILQARITSLQEQRVALIRNIQALERERLALEVGGPNPLDPTGSSSLIEEIGALQVQLAQASRRLGETHPEVMRLHERIDNLRAGGARDLAPGVLRQVALIDQQLQTMTDERDEIDQNVVATDRSIARVPQVAERLENLERRRRGLEVQREAVEARLAGARLDEQLISDEHGERMVILDRATPPEHPQSSSRRRIAILGLAASVGLAFLAAFVQEMRNPVVRTPRQLQSALGVGPIAVALRRPSPGQRVASNLRVALTILILAAGGFASWQFIAPPTTDLVAEG